MHDDKYRTLKSKLRVFHEWPGPYLFKFIVPAEKKAELEALFEGHPYRVRSSRSGRYFSLTCERQMASSEEVIEVYRRVEQIEGSYSL
jgi:putative lipoic acid-binding regulatory protein